MTRSSFYSIASLGLALTTAVATRAEAQRRAPVTVCRDGAHFDSTDSNVCRRHGGVDVRATEDARRYEADRNANGRWGNNRNDRDDRYGRNDRDDRDRRHGRNDRDDDRNDRNRSGDPRYGTSGNYDPRYGSGRGEVYEWAGRVDKEIRIQLRGDHAYVQPVGAGDSRSGRGRVLNGVPRGEGRLVVEQLQGRGSVDVLMQPSSRNGYTATLRVRDPQGGASNYHIVAYWEPAYGSTGRYGDDRYGYGRN